MAMQWTKSSIEEMATDTLHRHGLHSIPVDLIALANRLGIKVNNAKFSEPNLAALLSKRGSNVWILLDEASHPHRKRFSIAHELGHHFLHLETDGEMIDRDTNFFRVNGYGSDETAQERLKEIEANQFAAALLMPERLIRQSWQDRPSISKLARLFQVSEEAMGYRIAALGLD